MKKVLTYHVHGSYLYYLSQTECIFYIPVKNPPVSGFFGKTDSFPWGENVIEVPADDVRNLDLDCIIFQSNFNPADPQKDYLKEQTEILSRFQLQNVPRIFLEHDPPRKHPTDTRHFLENPKTIIVHVTPFNSLMWDCGELRTEVIDHGVLIPEGVKYSGELAKGVVVINNLGKRGRRMGPDIFEKVRQKIPLDLVGMGSEQLGGLGEVPPRKLASFISHYRFFFSPVRYTSLGLSLLEAMMVGMPIVGLATTEQAIVIADAERGFSSTDVDYLIEKMRLLLNDKTLCLKLGRNARKYAQKRFNIERFKKDWESLIEKVSGSAEGAVYDEQSSFFG